MEGKEKILEQLSAYLDGQLDGGEAERVRRAVESDKELAAELDQLRAVRGLIRGLPRHHAPKGFVEAVLAQAERPRLVGGTEGEGANRAIQWVRYLATAAVLLVAVSVAAVVVATLWKTSGFDYKPAAGRHRIGPVAAAPRAAEEADEADKGHTLEKRGGGEAGLAQPTKNGKFAHGKRTDTLALGPPVTMDKAVDGATAPEHAEVALKEDIVTDDLRATAEEVEKVFLANGVVRQVAVASDEIGGDAAYRPIAKKGAGRDLRRENFFEVRSSSREQVQFVVVALPEQAKAVLAGLEAVRARQEARQEELRKLRRAGPTPAKSARGGAAGRSGPAEDEAGERQTVEGLSGHDRIRSLRQAAKPKEQKALLAAAKPGAGARTARARAAPAAPGKADAVPATAPAQVASRAVRLQRLLITLNRRPVAEPAAGPPGGAAGAKAELLEAKKSPTTQPAEANRPPVTATQAAPAE